LKYLLIVVLFFCPICFAQFGVDVESKDGGTSTGIKVDEKAVEIQGTATGTINNDFKPGMVQATTTGTYNQNTPIISAPVSMPINPSKGMITFTIDKDAVNKLLNVEPGAVVVNATFNVDTGPMTKKFEEIVKPAQDAMKDVQGVLNERYKFLAITGGIIALLIALIAWLHGHKIGRDLTR